MSLSHIISKIQKDFNLTQEQFAAEVRVTADEAARWANGAGVPDLNTAAVISERFGISLDELAGEARYRIAQPCYETIEDWETYSQGLVSEFTQATEEGLDIAAYADLFKAVENLPKGKYKAKLADVLFEIVSNAPQRAGYPYREPSDLAGIRALRPENRPAKQAYDRDGYQEKLYGAWMGRICGCMLGKTVECMSSPELTGFLKESGNYPMHRYILSTDKTDERCSHYRYRLQDTLSVDQHPYMPYDDDTNYVVLAQEIIEKYGRNFTSRDVAQAWLHYQPKDSYCTAERVAFCNFIKGYQPPDSAAYQNPYREWIGAQIRGDYFGYINPGDPEQAAEMAFRDACISHVKNGIYGEMFASAMIACAAVCSDRKAVILGGLSQVPATSRLYESVMSVIDGYEAGVSAEDCYKKIHEQYNEFTSHGWCHTVGNAMVVAASLLYGEGDYGRSICMAVQTGFDTDCNGATVGSVMGMILGFDRLGREWTDPIHDTLQTTLFGMDMVKVSERAAMTLKHLE